MLRKFAIWWGPRGYNVLALDRPISERVVLRVLLVNGAEFPTDVIR